MQVEPIAHTRNALGKQHALTAHLLDVAELASGFAENFGAADAASYLGLCHDLGKFHPDFQRYLANCEANPAQRGHGPDHKAAGARLAARSAGVAALLVQGHHGGLRTPGQFKQWLEGGLSPEALEQVSALAQASGLLPALEAKGRLDPPPFAQSDARSAEFFLRLLFSALVDADYLDTECHFSPERSADRGHDFGMRELWVKFKRDQERLLASSSGKVNELRRVVYEDCLAAAEEVPGLFRLTVPTGGGKTRSAMAFALRHASLHGQERVVVAIPFISITEQTADVYRGIFEGEGLTGSPIVLEHHSGVADAFSRSDDEDATAGQDQHSAAIWRRLASENWDAPVIVTTTVQLFESLFASRPARTRKLHRLARSVIILDEAQSLPPHLLAPCLDALRELCQNYGTTVILCTATQSAFEEVAEFRELLAREIVSNPKKLFQRLRRVEYDWRVEEPLDWVQVAGLMADEPQALAVLNTKKDALALLEHLHEPTAVHLSTLLCGAHRRAVLAEVRGRLLRSEPCTLVATQVVEAGVDLDFPLVLRAVGPLDAIIQAAGRCNREGRRERGRVIVFDPQEGSLPTGAYKTGAGITRALFGSGPLDLNAPDAPREYFRRLFQTVETDREGIQRLRQALDFPEVSGRFRFIHDDQESIVVTSYGDAQERRRVRERLEVLRRGSPEGRFLLRALQPYTVSVRSQVAALLLPTGLHRSPTAGPGRVARCLRPRAGVEH